MAAPLLSRRRALSLGLGTGLVLLGGCRSRRPQLLASRGDLPTAWSRTLPRPWQVLLQDSPADLLTTYRDRPGSSGLLQLSDGWAAQLRPEEIRPFAPADLPERLDPIARPVARLFGPPDSDPVAFPWSLSPWVLLLRNRSDLVGRAAKSWDVLLDPSLQRRLVLPSSPRVIIRLMGGNRERLRRLREQAVAFDESNGLNLLMTGEAEAAVLPRHRVVPLLRRDPRLQAVLPATGSPLSWNLLLRTAAPLPPPPPEWFGEALRPPLLPRLLALGWVPPLPRSSLEEALAPFSAGLRSLLLPPAAVLARCHSLPPLAPDERRHLQALWDGSSP